MARFPLIGPAYTLASVSADCQDLVNWYLEVDETKSGRSPIVMKRTPGLTVFCDLSALGPIRGMWAGEYRLFAVAGSSFVEVFSDGTYSNNSAKAGATTVGNDGNPATILANGLQVLIVSAGNVYCDSGLGPVLIYFNAGSGTVDTAGTAVSWDSGSQFFNLEPDQLIQINGVTYQIQAVTDATDITLYTSAGVQSGVSWLGYACNGTVRVEASGPPPLSVVTLLTGDPFPANLAEAAININGTNYSVTAVAVDRKSLTISSRAISGGPYPYGANVPISAFTGTYIDTYFVVAHPASKNFYISANGDGTTWDAADTAQKEGYPDNIAFIKADHQQLIIGGDECSLEVWLDTGAALFPFQRNASQTIHWGCRAPWSAVRFGNGIAWIGGDQERGGPFVFYAEGSSDVRISTHAIEQAWARYAVVYDAVAYAKIEDGHEMLIISFPTANATWCYDRTASAQLGIPCWHRRSSYNATTGNQDRHRASYHASVQLVTAGKTPAIQPPQSYVGDWQTSPGQPGYGKIYTTDPTMVNDAGTPIARVRTAPHVGGQDNLYTSFDRFEALIDLGPGTGTPPVPPPVSPAVSYSKDGGHTFVNPQTRTVSPGQADQWQCRFVWRRQGESRTRTYTFTMNDQTQFTVLDAFYEADPGNA